MSATEITNALPKLTKAQLQRALQLKEEIETLEAALRALLRESGTDTLEVDLRGRGMDEEQAADLRARLKTFAEDWDRPEAAIYDEDPTR